MFCRLVVCLAAATWVAGAQEIRVVEEIAAKVNGDIITRGELEQERKEAEQAMRAQGVTGARLQEQLREMAANSLRDKIDQFLLVQRGKDLGISVDADVNKQLAEIQVRSKIADQDKFHEYIREGTGMSYEDYRDQMKRQYMAQRVISQEVTYNIKISEPELQKYYDEHKDEFIRKDQVMLAQILISTEGKTPEQATAAQQKAKDVVARARKGEKFADLVREFSDDTETASNGGELPALTPELLDEKIRDVVFKADKGYVTDPFVLPQGLLILKVLDRQQAGQASFEEVKSDVQERVARPLMDPKIREYLTVLRQQAYLEIKEGYVDTGAAPGKDTRWQDVQTLRPQTTTKEEVAARNRQHKRFIVFPVPGTVRPESGEPAPAPPITEAPAPAPPPAPAVSTSSKQ